MRILKHSQPKGPDQCQENKTHTPEFRVAAQDRWADAAQYSHDLAEDGGVLNGGVVTRNRPGNRSYAGLCGISQTWP